MTTPAGIYPFSTQDGKVIPLDIIKPLGIIVCAFEAAGGIVATSVIPGGSVVGVLTSDADCFVQFGLPSLPSALVNNTLYLDTVFILANAVVTVTLPPGAISIVGRAKAGSLVIQIIDQWVGLGLVNQYGRK